MNQRTATQIAVSLVVVATLLSGCAVNNPGYNGNIVFSGDMGETDGKFEMNGEITNSGVKNITFDSVRVLLYHTNKTIIDEISLGALDGSAQISVEKNHIPKYVLIDSPDFWNTPKVEVDYYIRAESGDYTVHTATDRSQLPISP